MTETALLKPASRDDVLRLIRDVLELPANHAIDVDAPPADVSGWDSYGWMNIIVAVEQAGDVEMPLDILDDAVTVGDFCDMVLSLYRR